MISKVWVDDYDNVEAACKKTLENLGLDYLDLYMIHWPMGIDGFRDLPPGTNTSNLDPKCFRRTNIPIHKIWPQMEALVEKGLVKSIGVSNFNIQMMWDLLCYANIKPAVNEVELHPLNV
jgi:diketogulonate reductase-like aldo/keto reductase